VCENKPAVTVLTILGATEEKKIDGDLCTPVNDTTNGCVFIVAFKCVRLNSAFRKFEVRL
jgi:hypothetical protein